MSPELQRELDKTVDSSEKAALYAEAGLWYDALGEALKLARESHLGEVGSSLLQDLANWEQPEAILELNEKERTEIEQRIEHLRQIANSAK